MAGRLLVDRSPPRGLPILNRHRALFDYLLSEVCAASRVQIDPVEGNRELRIGSIQRPIAASDDGSALDQIGFAEATIIRKPPSI